MIHPTAADFSDTALHQQAAHLRGMISDRLLTAARRGWTPDDLRHALGTGVTRFLPVVYPSVSATAHHRISTAWEHQLRRPPEDSRTIVPLPDLESLLDALLLLPPLEDAEHLADLPTLWQGTAGGAGLDDDQRRARNRITGLLKKAESTTFAAEAEALLAKAQQLRQRYRINNALEIELGDVVSARVHLSSPWIRFQFLLLDSVAVPNACRAVLLRPVGIATVVGHPDDVRHCLELFESLNHQRDYFMRHSPGAAEASHRRRTTAYRRSFLYAYANRVQDLLEQATADVPVGKHATPTAVPVLAARDLAAEEARDRIFPLSSSMSFGHSLDLGGAGDGITAAERSHLGPSWTSLHTA